ncbi:ABC transporter permease [Kineosporia sp. J2-2]|uniref:ABC transporter permease n=1 Tax=Kineosporia corallincola TaxID=2835133 RepID=A0ABS5TDB7_9ACTN|nr:ABC transporter permease [Kineosporia corallincola]MBT0769077.1 ABC transporter permease [Kineosporia corallincola]
MTEPTSAPEVAPETERRRERHFWVRAAVVAALGVVILTLLGSALLSVSHAPTPHHVPLGYVGAETTRTALAEEAGEAVRFVTYDSRNAAIGGIDRMDTYGAVVVSESGVELLKSTAASPQVASALTALVTEAAAGASLTPTVTETSALPTGDSAGSSIAVLLQVVVLVGTIGSVGLGRLVPRYRANWARGELPVLFLVLYALVVGLGIATVSHAFGVGNHVHFFKLSLCLALINLSVTASVSALVSLVGSAGAGVGGILYFLLGSPISGAATALPLMPVFWKDFGQALPPGAGATLLRRVLYFPEAPLATELTVLILYAGIGAVVLGVVNLLAGAGHRNSLADLP